MSSHPSLNQFAEDVLKLVLFHKNGWSLIDFYAPTKGAFRNCMYLKTLKIHTAIIKPSLGYRLAPPKVRILPPIDHPCVNQESGLVHMEENGFWNRARNTVNPLEHISIALRKEFRLV